jgi:hypothetical protein
MLGSFQLGSIQYGDQGANWVYLVGAVTSTSGASGTLSVATQLVGMSDAASSATGVLSVGTLGRSVITATSNVTGSLSVTTQFEGSSSSTSAATGNPFNVQPGLFGGVGAVSTTTALMAVIPGFGATGIPWRPHDGILETLEWKTSILKAFNGTEQRIKSRQSPRQFFKLRLLFDTDKKNSQYEAMLFSRQKETWLFPVWSEFVEHTTDINKHDTTISVDTTFADYRENNKALIWKSETEYEFVAIESVTDSLLTLDPNYSIQCDFTGDKLIMPVRTAYMVSRNRKSKTNSPVAFVDAVFAVTDNTGIAGYTQAANYDSLNLLVVPAFMEGVHLESSDADAITLDYGTGIFSVVSDSIYNFLSQSHVFYNDTKQAAWEFRQFLYSLDGRQKTVLIPTFRDDLVQVSGIDIEPLDTSVVIENIRLAKNMGANNLRTYLGFYFVATNVLIVRKITGITELDPDQERIDFDVDLDLATAVSAGDCKICFVDKCRLASDKVEIQWLRSHYNQCTTNFMRVP